MNDDYKEYLKAQKAKNMRYKRPALQMVNFHEIDMELDEMQEHADNVRYCLEGAEDELISALCGDEEEAYEFRMGFCDLSAKLDQFREAFYENGLPQNLDDIAAALIGNRYEMVGYDSYEEDYFSLCSYDRELASTEAGKRLMRMSKAEMISCIGQCLNVFVSFVDLRYQYDCLKAAIDILEDANRGLLRQVDAIEAAYEAAAADGFMFDSEKTKKYDEMLKSLPDWAFIQ